MLVQWLYLGRVNFGELEPEEAITATIAFPRISDMYKVTGMEASMAERIRDILLSTLGTGTSFVWPTTAYCLTTQHTLSAALLPKGHAVRNVLVSAVVQIFLQGDDRFLKEAEDIPDLALAVDLFREVKVALKCLPPGGRRICFKSSLTGEYLCLAV